ncbi:flagellar hook-length control protein FliK [Pseudomonas poae]|uniref:Flagellar hook-length control protein FliK n=1 Tax=Pseudomonas poae TaxID=200451 RepID=A0A2S9EKX1_9PSED|nr:flagellar hook-length control protein FliK [Pseudomonas poae]PRA26784.1 flagellar hook-length control protein FliK [Pseudomonas poae]PRC15954.1 flagellar hook-length control protein FliK [Pseudomonas poae]
MDILATLMPQATVPAQAGVPVTDTPTALAESFSAVLSQVTADVPQPLPVVTPQLAEPVEVPAPVVMQALPVVEEEAALPDEVLSVLPDEPVAEVDAPKPTTKSDSTLDDIRQRMALIESAGQSDTASVIVVPPIPLSVPVPLSSTPEEPAPVISSAPVHTQSLPIVDDEPDDTVDPVDSADTLPTLVATVADSVPTVQAHTDDRPPDSQPDPQTVFSLAPTSFTPSPADNVASTGLALTAAIGSTDWAADLGQQMVDMVTRGDQQVDLRLHPAELGPLSISLNLNDGTTQAQFQVAHASVRVAVEQALPQLREALATQGIALGQASVSDQSSRQQPQRDPQPQSASAPVNRIEPTTVQPVVLSGSAVDLYV